MSRICEILLAIHFSKCSKLIFFWLVFLCIWTPLIHELSCANAHQICMLSWPSNWFLKLNWWLRVWSTLKVLSCFYNSWLGIWPFSGNNLFQHDRTATSQLEYWWLICDRFLFTCLNFILLAFFFLLLSICPNQLLRSLNHIRSQL